MQGHGSSCHVQASGKVLNKGKKIKECKDIRDFVAFDHSEYPIALSFCL